MSLFDLSKPGAAVIKSTFGGGWIIPLTPEGSQALMEFFGEEPSEIPVPIGEGAFPFGYIVEPHQAGDLAEHLRGAGIAWRVE